ncbi:MAG: hemerythrin domain-containing protein [Lachnospiraceae bacterium]|nr:hemerythrin domain-containing protein [Lachnospiraceae bacterium]
MGGIKWNDRFNLGVELIDKAHQQLFAIVNKLILLTEDAVKQQHACKEGIKFFKSYALKHFAQEEEYMRRIAYKKYDGHKRLHDEMKNHILPELEREMEEQNYSEESIQHFMGICIGWLNAHILVEDRAILKGSSKWVHDTPGEELSSLKRALLQGMHRLFRIDGTVVSENYSGENFYPGSKICYRLAYHAKEGQIVKIYFIYEDRQILRLLSDILGRRIERLDQTAVYAMRLLSERLVEYVNKHFPLIDGYKMQKSEILSFEQLMRTFNLDYPTYSLLVDMGGYGHAAFCILL